MNRQQQLDIISVMNELIEHLTNPPKDTKVANANMIKILSGKIQTITDQHTYEDDDDRVEKEHKE
tara:strand:- start:1974 stop:2168 length:195 start_codon:yes stop_codon:yes gene_type:complete